MAAQGSGTDVLGLKGDAPLEAAPLTFLGAPGPAAFRGLVAHRWLKVQSCVVSLPTLFCGACLSLTRMSVSRVWVGSPVQRYHPCQGLGLFLVRGLIQNTQTGRQQTPHRGNVVSLVALSLLKLLVTQPADRARIPPPIIVNVWGSKFLRLPTCQAPWGLAVGVRRDVPG